MLNAVRSESLKFRRSFDRRLALAAPWFFALFAAVAKLYLPAEGMDADVLTAMIFNWWPVVFIPIGTAVLCALAELRDRRAGRYRALRTHDVDPAVLWYGKIAAVGLNTLLSSAMLIVAATAACLIVSRISPALIGSIVLAGFLLWASSLALIPLHLFAAFLAGPFSSILLGFAGALAGVLAADRPYWLAVPWSWPVRLMAPVIGVHPNGVLLPEGDPLLDSSAVPAGLTAAAVFTLAAAVLTAAGFRRSEVR